jgi:hypothetical protein
MLLAMGGALKYNLFLCPFVTHFGFFWFQLELWSSLFVFPCSPLLGALFNEACLGFHQMIHKFWHVHFQPCKKKNSKLFEYTHFMDKIDVVLEIECNLMKDIQWPCLGLIL